MERTHLASRSGKAHSAGCKNITIPLHCTIEFKLLYQFHATIPENWKPMSADASPEELLLQMCKTPSGAFGARNTPAFLRAPAIKSIEWGRKAGCASFNDFRQKFGLGRMSKWSEVHADPNIQTILAEMYPGGVDDLELYVGSTIEEYRPESKGNRPDLGWSIPPSLYTAIKNDAVSSLVGDMFYQKYFNSDALTEWGYKHALESGRLATLVTRHTSLTLPPQADLLHFPKGVSQEVIQAETDILNVISHTGGGKAAAKIK
jgi:hypothetical protein